MDDKRPTFLFLMLEAVRRLFADEAIPLAGNIAFRSVFSLFPFLIFITALAGFFGTEEQAQRLVDYLLSVAPEQLVRPLESEIRSILTVPRTGLLSLAALLTIWSAMAGVDSVRVGLNRAYDLKEHRPTWLLYLIDVFFVIGAAFFIIILSYLLIFLPLIFNVFKTDTSTFGISLPTIENFRIPLAILLLYVGLHVAHRVLPAKRLSPFKILPGIILTLVIWFILTLGFSSWLQNFNSFASTYSSLSGLFAAMFFIYLAALVLIFGGEFNRVLDLHATDA